jgi:hypothetical protein
MMRLPAALLLLSTPAFANSAEWFDPDRGCGRGAAFAKTGKVADLPGCTGRLPKNPPQVEVVLHDTKRNLVDAEEYLGKNKLDKIDPLLDAATASLAHAPPLHPELPDRWEQSKPLYERAIASLRNRRRLVPRLEKLRATHHAAVEAGKVMTQKEREGGPTDALAASKACLAEFAAARSAGVDFAADVDLEKDRLRPLDDGFAECEQVRKTAEPLVRAIESVAKARRAAFRKKLKGDRLKTFDAHAGAFPELDGKPLAANTAAKATTWRYTTAAGVEVYTFKANKLLSNITVKK